MERAVPSLQRIVIGVDFGAPSLDAARWVARELAPDGELLLVHALDHATAALSATPLPAKPSSATPSPAEPVAHSALDLATQRLRELADTLGGRADVRVEVREGRPAAAVASLAEECGVDLIVVGPHGGRESSSAIGSTAEQLVRVSPIPVLLATGVRSGAPRRLLVPLDDVDLNVAILEWADLFVRLRDAALSLMYVRDARQDERPERSRAFARAGAGGVHADPGFEDDPGAAERWLSGWARELSDAGNVDLIVAAGVPGAEILAAARRIDAELIVMGRRGRGRVLPGVLGSTCSMVLRGVSCPVLIVVDPRDAVIASWEDGETDDDSMV